MVKGEGFHGRYERENSQGYLEEYRAKTEGRLNMATRLVVARALVTEGTKNKE